MFLKMLLNFIKYYLLKNSVFLSIHSFFLYFRGPTAFLSFLDNSFNVRLSLKAKHIRFYYINLKSFLNTSNDILSFDFFINLNNKLYSFGFFLVKFLNKGFWDLVYKLPGWKGSNLINNLKLTTLKSEFNSYKTITYNYNKPKYFNNMFIRHNVFFSAYVIFLYYIVVGFIILSFIVFLVYNFNIFYFLLFFFILFSFIRFLDKLLRLLLLGLKLLFLKDTEQFCFRDFILGGFPGYNNEYYFLTKLLNFKNFTLNKYNFKNNKFSKSLNLFGLKEEEFISEKNGSLFLKVLSFLKLKYSEYSLKIIKLNVFKSTTFCRFLKLYLSLSKMRKLKFKLKLYSFLILNLVYCSLFKIKKKYNPSFFDIIFFYFLILLLLIAFFVIPLIFFFNIYTINYIYLFIGGLILYYRTLLFLFLYCIYVFKLNNNSLIFFYLTWILNVFASVLSSFFIFFISFYQTQLFLIKKLKLDASFSFDKKIILNNIEVFNVKNYLQLLELDFNISNIESSLITLTDNFEMLSFIFNKKKILDKGDLLFLNEIFYNYYSLIFSIKNYKGFKLIERVENPDVIFNLVSLDLQSIFSKYKSGVLNKEETLKCIRNLYIKVLYN